MFPDSQAQDSQTCCSWKPPLGPPAVASQDAGNAGFQADGGPVPRRVTLRSLAGSVFKVPVACGI